MIPCPHCGNSDEVEITKNSGVCRSCGGEWVALYETDLNGVPPHELGVKLGDCLDEAKATICGERQDQYGNPEDSFALIGAYWATYLQEKAKAGTAIVSAKDVAHMMILFKVARCQGQKPKRDNYVDICGYAAIAADRLMEEK